MTDLHTYSASGSDRIRRFVLEREVPLVESGRRRYATPEEAEAHPVAAAVMAVPGVQEVILEGNAVIVLRRGDLPWEALEDRIGYAIGTALGRDREGPAEAAGAPLPDDRIFDLVAQILERDINPAVAGHGGKVELIDVQDGTVVVRMMGGCQGCGMANVTLRQGIEAQLRRLIPGLRGLRDITDHASGTNPYFR
jgi:Fe-S cluster biogenesis protein NfuA